jgi:hypothetical protein
MSVRINSNEMLVIRDLARLVAEIAALSEQKESVML